MDIKPIIVSTGKMLEPAKDHKKQKRRFVTTYKKYFFFNYIECGYKCSDIYNTILYIKSGYKSYTFSVLKKWFSAMTSKCSSLFEN